MSNQIKILDPFTANQIAAGEVVERPASVVKELVENSLDAGANKIEIAVMKAGVELIRVSDNGFGMNKEDAVLAFQRHATSKISSPADLVSISTLGFRGEALPSIASVSHVEVLTREPESLTGSQILLGAGKAAQIQDIGCPVGTTILVKDLFYNTPARRKFLKSDATELGQISDLIGRMAMAYPQVAFKYSNEGRVLLQTSGTGNLLEAVSEVYGKEQARQMIAVDTTQAELTLQGYLGKPSQSRASRTQQTFYINGRYIRSKTLSMAIAEGYHTLLPVNKFPVVVLNLSLPLDQVDVNVHPTKLEVRFTQEREIIKFVADSVRRALYDSNLIPGLGIGPEHVAESPAAPPAVSQVSETFRVSVDDSVQETQLRWQEEMSVLSSRSTLSETVHSEGLNGTLILSTEPSSDNAFAALSDKTLPEQAALNTAQVLNPDVLMPPSKLPDLLPLGQVDLTYIVASGPEGLYIIDQHAAHERINFEHLWENAQGTIETQLLLEPLTIELSPQEMSVLVENIVLFTDLGFLLEHFGGNTFLLRSYPVNLATGIDLKLLLHDLLDLFLDGPKRVEARFLRKELIYTMACKSSIKAHEALNRVEMEHLLLRLNQTQNPYTCPHGRPTIIAITSGELAKRFQRT